MAALKTKMKKQPTGEVAGPVQHKKQKTVPQGRSLPSAQTRVSATPASSAAAAEAEAAGRATSAEENAAGRAASAAAPATAARGGVGQGLQVVATGAGPAATAAAPAARASLPAATSASLAYVAVEPAAVAEAAAAGAAAARAAAGAAPTSAPAAAPAAAAAAGNGGGGGGEEASDVIFVLEKASLEVGNVGKTYQLLNCDDHANFLRKHKKDPALYRPDIVHQTLLAILDSPLNKAGRLKNLFINTNKGVLIQVNPQTRLPRTFRRFCGLMVQLLQKLSIRATNGPEKLLKVVKQPVVSHLPSGCRRIGLEFNAAKVVQMRQYIKSLPKSSGSTLVFVVGAMANEDIDTNYVDDVVAVSEYPLSAACCVSRVCNALELKWGIL